MIPKYKFNTIAVTNIIIIIFISSWYCSYQYITSCIREKYVNIIRKTFVGCYCVIASKSENFLFYFIDNWHGPKYVYDIHNTKIFISNLRRKDSAYQGSDKFKWSKSKTDQVSENSTLV